MAQFFAGLIGDPVAHSRSPAIQNAAFQHLGIDAHFQLWHTPIEALPARIAMLREPSILGANVTLPHKTAVIPYLDELEPEAAYIGAVNAIYKQEDGTLTGANTDAPGLLDDLQESGQFQPEGQRVVILGASGAARAAAYILLQAGVNQLVIANRSLPRAESLAADLQEHVAVMSLSSSSRPQEKPEHKPEIIALMIKDTQLHEYIANCNLLINATSVGWNTDETPYPDVPVVPGMLVYDMVYRQTRLLREAAERGASTLDGLGMLVRQGALAFTRWTGRPAPMEIMRETLIQAVQ